MDDRTRIALLKLQTVELTARTPFCPEDQQIAEYFDGDLAEAERNSLQHHLADCRFCLARVGVLERLQQNAAAQRVPEDLLATAKLLQSPRPQRRSRWQPAWAAAAVLVMALATVLTVRQEPAEAPDAGPPSADSNTGEFLPIRSIRTESAYLEVYAPAPGADLAAGGLVRWAAVPGKAYYSISILTLAGDVLWSERLDDNEWRMRDSLQLAAEHEFYLRVDAHLSDGRTVSSKHRLFRKGKR